MKKVMKKFIFIVKHPVKLRCNRCDIDWRFNLKMMKSSKKYNGPYCGKCGKRLKKDRLKVAPISQSETQ